MTDIQLMRDIIKNNFHFFPIKITVQNTLILKLLKIQGNFSWVLYTSIKQYTLSAPQLSFYVIYKIRENLMKDDPNYNRNENVDFFVIY